MGVISVVFEVKSYLLIID